LKSYLYENLNFSESYDYFFIDKELPIFLAIGPCAIENRKMALDSVKFCNNLNIKFFRAFLFKSRTSIYSFQGIGKDGIEILQEIKSNFPNIKLICEISTLAQYEFVKDYIDIFQIGARSMYDTELLVFFGKKNLPIILKRHFGANINEWLNMAEYYLYNGGRRILLCERGIKSFESSYRYSFDILSSSFIKQFSKIPVIADPSHPSGNSLLVTDLSLAAIVAGFKGLIIETHPNPESALSDPNQQLSFNQFIQLFQKLKTLNYNQLLKL